METANFEKTLLFFEQDYEQHRSTGLWIVRANIWFKKHFCGKYPFYETLKTLKIYWNISLLLDQVQEQEKSFF